MCMEESSSNIGKGVRGGKERLPERMKERSGEHCGCESFGIVCKGNY